MPIWAHAIWTAIISGHVKAALQSRDVPKEAPAIEYVAMPEGSSSAAPVMTPGPMMARDFEIFWPRRWRGDPGRGDFVLPGLRFAPPCAKAPGRSSPLRRMRTAGVVT
jgi:hypothetical protein